jgi:hypothetical protein
MTIWRGNEWMPDPKEAERWVAENAEPIYAALQPHGTLSPDGSRWCVDNIEVALKGPRAGWVFDAYTGEPIRCPLYGLSIATGERWPTSLDRAYKLAVATARSPNGHDQECRVEEPPNEDGITAGMNLPHLGNGLAKIGLQRSEGRAADQPACRASIRRRSARR